MTCKSVYRQLKTIEEIELGKNKTSNKKHRTQSPSLQQSVLCWWPIGRNTYTGLRSVFKAFRFRPLCCCWSLGVKYLPMLILTTTVHCRTGVVCGRNVFINVPKLIDSVQYNYMTTSKWTGFVWTVQDVEENAWNEIDSRSKLSSNQYPTNMCSSLLVSAYIRQ
jgi:hypothetical protein